MNSTFDLAKQLKRYASLMRDISPELKKGVEDNARKACIEAEAAVKAKTPHPGDGKQRGQNMITGGLQSSWHVTYEPQNGTTIGTVQFRNDKPYAEYVQSGHRVTKHFVPWLYKDGNILSREINHNQPLFGLVVGGKTPFVKGIDMVGAGTKKFNEVFRKLNQELFKRMFSKER